MTSDAMPRWRRVLAQFDDIVAETMPRPRHRAVP
jgi:hypothetical protein